MRIDWKIAVIITLAACWRHDAKAGLHNTRLLEKEREKKHALAQLNLYLVETLEKNGFEMDEFDHIAVDTILKRK